MRCILSSWFLPKPMKLVLTLNTTVLSSIYTQPWFGLCSFGLFSAVVCGLGHSQEPLCSESR